MALKQCPECGKEISTDAPMCPHCGKPQTASAEREARARRFAIVEMVGHGAVALSSGIGLLLAGAVAWAFFHAWSPHDAAPTTTLSSSAASAVAPMAMTASAAAQNAIPMAAASFPAQAVSPPDSAPADNTPLPTRPYFALAQPNGLYGYAPALSASDQNQGIGASSLVMLRYLGHAVDTGEPVFDIPENDGFTRIWCIKQCTFARSIVYRTWGRGQPQFSPIAYGTILWEATQDASNGLIERTPTSRLTIPVAVIEEQTPRPDASFTTEPSAPLTVPSSTPQAIAASSPQPQPSGPINNGPRTTAR